MEILKKISLKPYNTFGVEAKAREFGIIHSIQDIVETAASKDPEKPFLILGEGSNILFVHDFKGLAVQNKIFGVEVTDETAEEVIFKVGGGENWPELVDWTVDKNWGGIENLSLIPGTVGAAPIQNIGAYGTELSETLVEVEAVDLTTAELVNITGKACGFGYRSSIFKKEQRGRYFITSVTLKLSKIPILNLSYAPLMRAFEGRDKNEITVKEVSTAVKAIRRSKLPDPSELGNAGSFFKNPVVENKTADKLKERFPDIPLYGVNESQKKLAAGWLIEKCGWKGKRFGDAGVHAKQALVLVNYGKATGREIFELSEKIRENVVEKFGVELEREVTVIR
jgi:UDP-N-acetylmuramate dehydrogenase